MNKFLIYLRRVLGALLGAISLLYFVDITNLLPVQLHGVFHVQVVPALMSVSVGLLIAMGLLTLVLGRIYCSIVCPLGILQDFILRIKIWYLRIVEKRKALKCKYQRPYNVIRYGVLGVVGVAFAMGISLPLMLLDPYSTFGRIALSIVRPVVIWGNNLLASVLNAAGNYSVYNMAEVGAPWFIVLFSIVVLVVMVVMVWFGGRLWCNTLCPVGSALGLISRFSLFRISLGEQCNRCGLCAGACKAHCIDIRDQSVDASRCVACFDCLDKCHKSGVKYAPTGWKYICKTKINSSLVASVQSLSSENAGSSFDADVSSDFDSDAGSDRLASGVVDDSRRRFLKRAAMAVMAVPVGGLLVGAVGGDAEQGFASDNMVGADNGGVDMVSGSAGDYPHMGKRTKLPMPPGVVSRERFERKCTACQLCVAKCPTHVLQPAFMENGFAGVMQPYMKFEVECFCNYECKVCAEVCPNQAILPMSIEQKKLTRVGYANFRRGSCVVFVENQDCGACAEHCPSQAVHMVDYKDGLTIPRVDVSLCIGCGGCESICPVTPAAIFVQGIDEQNQADVPKDDKLETNQITEFGF